MPRRERPASRLAPEARRRQLVGIGLSLLATKPIQQLTVEEVARTAGISRNLLFHYFSTKREFYAEVVGAACRRLLRATRGTSDGTPRQRLVSFVDGYVGFVDRHPESYASVIHRTGGDDWVRDIWEDCRQSLAGTVLDILGRDGAPPLTRQAVRGWLSLVEDMTLAWSAEHTVARATLVTLLADAAEAILALAERAPEGDD